MNEEKKLELNHAQKTAILHDGFVVVPGVVSKIQVDRALKSVNHSLGDKGMHPDELNALRSQSYCKEIQDSREIKGLFDETPTLSLAESAIGVGKIKPVWGGQIALRFPSHQDPPSVPRAHIDGIYSPHNGVKKGEISNFTALVCVLLSDLPEANAGNFTVWPGSHLKYESHFKEHGADALLAGMPAIDIGEPTQVTGKAGDIVIAHYLLGHSVASNVSANIRYAIFFRLQHTLHDEQKWESMTDAWLEWEGIKRVEGIE